MFRNKSLGLLTLLVGTMAVQTVEASSTGIIGRSKSSNTCNACHTGRNLNSQLELQGADTVASGELADLIIALSHDGAKGGFNLSADAGELIAGSGSNAVSGELTHSRPQNVSGGSNSWAVQWRAPEVPGDYKLYVCANAVNGDGTNNGDERITRCDVKTVTVGSSNSAPVATNDSASTAEDDAVSINVLSNDDDSDGSLDVSSVTLVSGPSNGAASVNNSGSITYTPESNFFGTDSFTYQVNDNEGESSNVATVSITVTSVNDTPIANADAASTSEDTAVSINVFSNDTDVEGELDSSTIVIEVAPEHGEATLQNGMISYQPDEGFSGSDSFEYSVADESGARSNNALVSISIVAVNDAPEANDDSASTQEDASISIDILANDADSDGTLDATSVQVGSAPANGEVTFDDSTGIATYTPSANFFGSDSFTYTVADNEGGRSAAATVSISVTSVNDAPVAANDSTGTNLDTAVVISVLNNDTDIDGELDASSITIDSEPLNGTAQVSGGGTITYTPNADFAGTDSLTYSVADDEGARSNSASVSISVRVNEPPVAQADSAETEEDTAVNIAVLHNDSDDIELDLSSVTIVSSPSAATVSVDQTSGVITFAPDANVFGEQQFSYQVSDFEGGTSEETLVTVSVTAVNDAPEIKSEPVLSVTQGDQYSYSVEATDVEEDELTVSLIEGPDWLAISDSVLSGVASVSDIGQHVVTLEVSDGQATDEQSFTLTVAERTDADLSISITSAGTAVAEGEIQLTAVLSNTGPADANDVVLTLELNRAITFSGLPDDCSADDLVVTCSSLQVFDGVETVLEFSANTDNVGDVSITASVEFAEENNPENNLAYHTFTVSGAILALASEEDLNFVAVVSQDINSDGLPDAIFIAADDSEHRVMLNIGSGQMQDSQLLTTDSAVSDAILMDINGDTFPDLVLASGDDINSHSFLNDGSGLFVAGEEIQLTGVIDAALADVNADSLPDLVAVVDNGALVVLLNEGDGVFSSSIVIDDANAMAVAVLDINQDDYMDIVTANGTSGGALYINNMLGQESLFATAVEIASGYSIGVSAGDMNMDGVADVAFANRQVNASGANSLYFSTEEELAKVADVGLVSTKAIYIIDVNGDQTADLVLLNEDDVHQTYLKQDDMTWTLQSSAIAGVANAIAIVDVNADGLADSLFAGSSKPESSVAFRTASEEWVIASADLSVSVTAASDVVMQGDSLEIDITIVNASIDFAAQSVELTMLLPSSLEVSESPDGCLVQQSTLMCELAQVAASDSVSMSIIANVVATTGELTLSPQVTALTSDPQASDNSASVAATINAVPVATNDNASVEENQSISISLLSNDSDDHGLDAATLVIVSSPANGSVSVSGSGSVSYTPGTDFTGSDSFTYQVTDIHGQQSNVATVTIEVTEKTGGGGSVYMLLMLLATALLHRRRALTKGF